MDRVMNVGMKHIACKSCGKDWGLLPVIEKGGIALLKCAPCGFQNTVEDATKAWREMEAKRAVA